MGIMHIPYNQQADPKAMFAQGFENFVGGLMQGRERKRLGEAVSNIGPNATPMEVAMMLLSERISPQIAMGMGGLQQRTQPSVGNIPWASTQMTTAQRQNWLDNYGRGVTIQTGQKLLDPEQRQEIAETEYSEKVGMSSTERANAVKSIENIFESTPASPWAYGWEDYSKEKVIGMYKQWITEQGPKTTRIKKRLDEIWDGKMSLMNKTGFKFKDKERARLSKNEIFWDPDDPEVRQLREGNIGGGQRAELPVNAEVGPQPAGRTEEPIIQGAMNEPDFEINDKTGEARKVFDERGEEVGIRLKDGQTFKIGNTMKRGGVTYKYIGDNQWQKQ